MNAIRTSIGTFCFAFSAIHAHAQSNAGLRLFLDTYQCALAHQLDLIHENQTRTRSRFILVSLDKASQRYVQCMFLENDRKFLCEASSGFYGPREGNEQTFRVSPQGLSALGGLGFVTGATTGNFQRVIEPPLAQNYHSVAKIILSALYLGYDAPMHSRLWYSVPLGSPKEFVPTKCIPSS